ncbi:hypothetical protein IQ247_26380 [Plectonema cf. radiosum LEGE 06105]|uniref:Uncharacterized protein n=1 Tax=Plectonema cf. radiosum LEGE 06105 TaxID=945769 RepID=A0A8J7JWZ0_9CYAN|nr:hypothetical protein [Plectonema radiosum]MBE9216145.1 hypothetical protein [Plectonema cf. radiosum LEGE 06105]
MKQKLSFNLSLVLIIIASSINATAIKANAGPLNAQGSPEDSSGSAGGSFNPDSQTTPQLAPGIENSIQLNNGQLSISLESQERLNQEITKIISNFSPTGGDEAQINSIINLLRGSNPIQNRDRVEKSLTGIGISKGDAVQLIESVVGLFAGFDSASTQGIPVASNKSLTTSYIAQNSQQNVDINKLNTAVNAYNKIIMKSNAKTLKKLAANPEFMEIRNILNQLRSAFNE